MIKDPILVGKWSLKNRMVKAPIHSDTCWGGKMTEKTYTHYDERTQGGRFGLVVVEHCYIRSDGIASRTQMSISDDSDIEYHKRLVDLIHRNGSTAILQLNHAGCGALRKDTSQDSISASDVSVTCGWPASDPNPERPKPLTVDGIKALEEAYLKAAMRGMKAGYDGIDVHSAHGYLLNQFFSPLTNHRTDMYNGETLAGRIRIHLEIIMGIRQVIGDKPLLALRLGGCDYIKGGSTIDDAVFASLSFEKAGVDLIDISGGLCCFVRPGHPEPGYFGDVSEAVKKKVHIPVLLTGGVKTLSDAEDLLQAQKGDLIGVGRAITADPKWGIELATK
ncbi:MAG: NADH:flavin oxidoreductase [Lachnospiraceae bacterium]|nr:NADH:flavin oxidoreductase [Lachnospiraceae bacterium]